jgi:signal transduction histidine kinase
MKDRFLSRRILAASVFWILATLTLTALLLMYFYWDHITRDFDADVLMHLEEMADQTRLDGNGRLETVPHPTDRRFHIPRSGWYWEILHEDRVLARSESLGEAGLDLAGLGDSPPGAIYRLAGPWGEELRMQLLDLPAAPGRQPVRLVAGLPLKDIRAEVIHMARHTALSFLILAAALVAALAVQLRIALRPLRAVSVGVARVRSGEAKTLSGNFPREVRPLVEQLNSLIEHSAIVALRARNRLGDLAHSIKNPLTALTNEAYNMNAEQRALVLEQTRHIEDSLKHHLTRARVFGTDKVLGIRTPVKPLVEDLVFLMQRVHVARALQFDTRGVGDCCFRGDDQDLEELVGNLLDNASKWASSVVRVHCHTANQRLRLTVEDDGPGIPEDRIEAALQGVQSDPSRSGQGRGLGIVADIVEMYGGRLDLSRSELGGLRAELQLPGTWVSC